VSNTSTGGASATTTKASTANAMKVVHTFAKNSFDEVWTYLQPFRGKQFAHVRIFTTGDDDEMRPTKKGITVRIDDVPKLADALTALVDAVKEQKS
jgi:Transcriptional Coactivator p15 (PC4)